MVDIQFWISSQVHVHQLAATFSTGGIAYSQVCGQARGYQHGDVTAFVPSTFDSQFDSYYYK